MNIELLKKRKHELCGWTRPSDAYVSHDDLAIILKLIQKSLPVTKERIQIEKMKLALTQLPIDAYRPFLDAIIQMYAKITGVDT